MDDLLTREDIIRLECLKLANKDPNLYGEKLIHKASMFEEYIRRGYPSDNKVSKEG